MIGIEPSLGGIKMATPYNHRANGRKMARKSRMKKRRLPQQMTIRNQNITLVEFPYPSDRDFI